MLRYLRIASSQNLEHEAFHTVGVKGMPEGDHFVEDAAERPNVTFLIVWLFLANFWRKVVWSTDGSLGAIIGMLQNPGYTKITDFDKPFLRCENVLGFEISVENFPIVDMLHGKRHLNEPVENLVLSVAHLPNLLLVRNFGVEVAAISVVHHDAEAPLVHEGLFVGNNIWVPHCLKHVDLIDSIFSLLTVHFRDVNDFHNIGLSVVH